VSKYAENNHLEDRYFALARYEGGKLGSLNNFIISVKDAAKGSNWQLFIEEFPSWISAEHTWSPDYAVAVSIQYIVEATSIIDGKIVIQFHQAEIKDVISSFLNEWENGACDPKTNNRKSPDELKIKATLVDSNKVEQNKSITLLYPNSCSLTASPSCVVTYSIID